jgi:hypothetical protein
MKDAVLPFILPTKSIVLPTHSLNQPKKDCLGMLAYFILPHIFKSIGL